MQVPRRPPWPPVQPGPARPRSRATASIIVSCNCRMYSSREDEKLSKVRDPLVVAIRWFQSRSGKERLILGSLGAFIVSIHPRGTGASRRAAAAPAAWHRADVSIAAMPRSA